MMTLGSLLGRSHLEKPRRRHESALRYDILLRQAIKKPEAQFEEGELHRSDSLLGVQVGLLLAHLLFTSQIRPRAFVSPTSTSTNDGARLAISSSHVSILSVAF